MKNYFRIRELRQKAKLTQAELADQLDFHSPSTITMWENGARKPPSTVLPKLAHVLDCSIQDLYSNSGSTV